MIPLINLEIEQLNKVCRAGNSKAFSRSKTDISLETCMKHDSVGHSNDVENLHFALDIR